MTRERSITILETHQIDPDDIPSEASEKSDRIPPLRIIARTIMRPDKG